MKFTFLNMTFDQSSADFTHILSPEEVSFWNVIFGH